jgi:iron complex transport system substrate-binding protein
MRIVSLIPSITELLIESGVNVVGRTRFCIHPQSAIQSIPAIAGTKDINWEKVAEVKPDLIIFDKEENTKEMADSCPFSYHVLHIQSINDVADALSELAQFIDPDRHLSRLYQSIDDWHEVANAPTVIWDFKHIPDLIENIGIQSQGIDVSKIKRVDYLIWKNPWMAIGPQTFIFSVLERLGLAKYLINRDEKYPVIKQPLDTTGETFYLFSSEPFPFQRYKRQLEKDLLTGAIIDGESYSWYGNRSLAFLQKQLNLPARN